MSFFRWGKKAGDNQGTQKTVESESKGTELIERVPDTTIYISSILQIPNERMSIESQLPHIHRKLEEKGVSLKQVYTDLKQLKVNAASLPPIASAGCMQVVIAMKVSQREWKDTLAAKNKSGIIKYSQSATKVVSISDMKDNVLYKLNSPNQAPSSRP